MHKPSLSSHSAGGHKVGRVPFALLWWTSGGHHRRGVEGTRGMERFVSTSFLGNPLARNTFSKCFSSWCLWASSHTWKALSFMHLITPAKTRGWCWELKGRYRSVCVGFRCTAVDILSPWHGGCRVSEANDLSPTGIKYNPMSLSKFFADGKHLSKGIWGWSKNGYVISMAWSPLIHIKYISVLTAVS